MTRDCITALRKSDRPCDTIILVDNGSRAEQRELLADCAAPDIRFVQLAENRGFAGGMNAGIAEAIRLQSDYVWLVNNDAFPEPNCLDGLLAAMQADTTLACVTPRLVGPQGEIQPAGGQYHVAEGTNDFLDNAALQQPVGHGGYWAVATAPLFRAVALKVANGFDERFFAYWEEVDLCLRLARHGYRFRAVPEVTAFHLGRASSAGSNFAHYLFVRNQFWLFRKHATRGRSLLKLIQRHLDNAGCYAAHGDTAKAQTVVEAVVAGLRRERGRPRGYGTMPTTGKFLAHHPWQLIRILGRLERSPKGEI